MGTVPARDAAVGAGAAGARSRPAGWDQFVLGYSASAPGCRPATTSGRPAGEAVSRPDLRTRSPAVQRHAPARTTWLSAELRLAAAGLVPWPWSRWPTPSPGTVTTTRCRALRARLLAVGTRRPALAGPAARGRDDGAPAGGGMTTGEVADVLGGPSRRYYDSVTLMLVSRDVLAVDEVSAAQVAMGTELNLDLLRGMASRRRPTPAARLVVGRCARTAGAVEPLVALEQALAAASAGSAGGDELAGDGLHRAPWRQPPGVPVEPDLALVSVPARTP